MTPRHADRRSDPGDVQSVRPRPAGHLHADRIGDGGDHLDGPRHARDPLRRQRQAIEHGRAQTCPSTALHIVGVGREDGRSVAMEGFGHGPERLRPLLGRGRRQRPGGAARLHTDRSHRCVKAEAVAVHRLL
jgi:hypothetical protein